MMRTLQSPWIALVIGILTYAATTAALIRPDKLIAARKAAQAVEEGGRDELISPSWAFKNPEVDEMLADIRSQSEALKIREQELNDLAARLAVERQEISTVTQRVAALQAEMDISFVRIQENELSNLKRLAKVYATMTPDGAAKILTEFQDDAAVKIFALMKENETAQILEIMARDGTNSARRVALISDRLRLLTAPPSTDTKTNKTPGKATSPVSRQPDATQASQ